jgi:ubiquinone/menaquinone biosynthesis C-methylase UbiE
MMSSGRKTDGKRDGPVLRDDIERKETMNMDAKKFDTMAREIFAPAYPLIAAQAVEHTGISEGVCLDIGCGGGYLGLALAQTTGLFVRFFDQSREMLDIVRDNIASRGLENRTDILSGNVESIPLPDGSVNLAVSRGSVFFWDRVTAFREINRVLAPGGMSYIGGGFGSAEVKAEVDRKMQDRSHDGPPWKEVIAKRLGPDAPGEFEEELRSAGIADFEIDRSDDKGLWIIIRKTQ